MDTLDLKEKYGYSVEKFLDFFKDNPDFPKGSFQVKKRGESFYWYYTLSTSSSDRVKYICKADSSNSFNEALDKLKYRESHGAQKNAHYQRSDRVFHNA